MNTNTSFTRGLAKRVIRGVMPQSALRLARDITGIHPQVYTAPGLMDGSDHFNESISDAFVWRSGRNICTRFDIMNLPTLIHPEDPCEDHVTVVVFSGDGSEIGRHSYVLEPFENRSIFLDDLLYGRKGIGTFAVFHSRCGGEAWPYEACLSERSYVGYRNPEETELWSYVHGCCNSYVLAWDSSRDTYRMLCRKAFRKQTFSSQMRFDECDRFEVIYTNPLSVEANILLVTEDPEGREGQPIARRLRPMETTVFAFDNSERFHCIARHQADVYAWRPLIFRYHGGYFDVLHS